MTNFIKLLRLPEVITKDVRQVFMTFDFYIILFIVSNYIIYLVQSNSPHPNALLVFYLLFCFFYSPILLNSFGLETNSNIDRYTILPEFGKFLLFAKNTSALLLTLIILVPICIIASFKYDAILLFTSFFIALLTLFMYIIFGNIISIYHSRSTSPYSFISLNYNFGFLRILFINIISLLPSSIIILLSRYYPMIALIIACFSLILLIFMWSRSLDKLGKSFELQLLLKLHHRRYYEVPNFFDP
jgi:hypothetical protein